MTSFRTGFGYDVHRLVEGRPMILAGINIPYPKGPLGHSDGDVLLHALADALLGSLALGDLGTYFPDTDPQFHGISSKDILSEVYAMIRGKGYRVENVDATVVLQEPKLSAFISDMRKSIAGHLSLKIGAVSVKATTTDHLGFIGEGKGIAAYAAVSIVKK